MRAAVSERLLHAEAVVAYAPLADAARFARVAAGRDAEAADPHWPAPGAAVVVRRGLVLRDVLRARRSEPGRVLALVGRVRPLLTADVELRLDGVPGGTRACLVERPTGGLLSLLPASLLLPLLRRRNDRVLARLDRALDGAGAVDGEDGA